MLTASQKATIGQARRACRLDDSEYRDWVEQLSTIPGCRSTTDPRLGNREFDRMLATFEAIYEASVHVPGTPRATVFQRPGYWQSKNPGENTSRDRYATGRIREQIQRAERDLFAHGYDADYCAAIRARATADTAYLAALRRTLRITVHAPHATATAIATA